MIILYLYSDILIIINQLPFTVWQPSPPWNYLETSFKHKLVNPRQQISTLANTYQPLSTNINPCQHMNLNLMFVNTENHSWISDAEKYISPFVVHFWRICILAVRTKALAHIKYFRTLHDLVSLWGRQPSEARQWGVAWVPVENIHISARARHTSGKHNNININIKKPPHQWIILTSRAWLQNYVLIHILKYIHFGDEYLH